MDNIKKGEKDEARIKALAELLDKCYDTLLSNYEEFATTDPKTFLETSEEESDC